jgi:hypothetical protein
LIGEQFIASNNSVFGFQLVVESILILHSEGAQVASASLQTFDDGDQAASQSDTSELIVSQLFVEFNLRAPSSALIVGYRSSKISFHFCEDCRIFRDGEREQINNGDANVKQRRISLDDLISLVGLIGLSGISGLVGRISLVGRIGLDGIIGLVGQSRIIQNGLVDCNNLVGPIGFSDISGLIDRISLVGPIIGFSGVIGLVGQISLKSALSASVSPQH